jgi:hypothetical protein
VLVPDLVCIDSTTHLTVCAVALILAIAAIIARLATGCVIVLPAQVTLRGDGAWLPEDAEGGANVRIFSVAVTVNPGVSPPRVTWQWHPRCDRLFLAAESL